MISNYNWIGLKKISNLDEKYKNLDNIKKLNFMNWSI